MWGETADASDVQQTIWPRAAVVAGILLDMLDYTKLIVVQLCYISRIYLVLQP